MHRIVEEIRQERLTGEEKRKIVNDFFVAHNFGGGSMLCCGSCGVQQLPGSGSDFPAICLSNLPSCFKWNKSRKSKLLQLIDMGPIHVPQDDSGDNWKQIHPWKAISFYSQGEPNKTSDIFHLHPELIHHVQKQSGMTEPATHLCPSCLKSTSTNKPAKFSLASGIDFGWFQRVNLLCPNAHKQAIIARSRNYLKVMKITLNAVNGSSGVTDFTLNKIMAHSILFPHNISEVVKDCLTKTHIANSPIHILSPRKEKRFFVHSDIWIIINHWLFS